MKFTNTNKSSELNFTIMGKDYKVEADGEVDIAPMHVPYVLRRGLQLQMGSKPVKKVVEEKKIKFDPKEVISKPIEKPATKE